MSVKSSVSTGPSLAYVGAWVALGFVSSIYIVVQIGAAATGSPAQQVVAEAPNRPELAVSLPATTRGTDSVALGSQPEAASPSPAPASPTPVESAQNAPASPAPTPQAVVTGSLPSVQQPPTLQEPPKRLPRVINLTSEPVARPSGAAQTAAAPVPPPAQAVPVAKTITAPTEKPVAGPFAVLLGAQGSLDEARASWAVTSAQSAALERLEPRVTATDALGSRSYRLAAGPLQSKAEAAKICAELRAAGITCRVGGFAGEAIPTR